MLRGGEVGGDHQHIFFPQPKLEIVVILKELEQDFKMSETFIQKQFE